MNSVKGATISQRSIKNRLELVNIIANSLEFSKSDPVYPKRNNIARLIGFRRLMNRRKPMKTAGSYDFADIFTAVESKKNFIM